MAATSSKLTAVASAADPRARAGRQQGAANTVYGNASTDTLVRLLQEVPDGNQQIRDEPKNANVRDGRRGSAFGGGRVLADIWRAPEHLKQAPTPLADTASPLVTVQAADYNGETCTVGKRRRTDPRKRVEASERFCSGAT